MIEDQPAPDGGRGNVQALVRADLEERERVGVERYGTPLRLFNGRDALVDAYQEAMDLTVYLRQAIAERDSGALDGVLREVQAERVRQAAKHGDQSHVPDGTAPGAILAGLPVAYPNTVRADNLARWAKARTQAALQDEGGDGSITFEHILTEEWAEAIAESDPAKLRVELIQVAAVAAQWIAAIDQREQRPVVES